MINLLTPDMRSRSKSLFWSRIGVLWTIALSTLAVIGLMSLLPAYETAKMTTANVTATGDGTTKAQDKAEETEVELADAQVLSQMLRDHVNGTTVLPALLAVREVKGKYASITISEVFARRTDVGPVHVTIDGFSKNREDLIALTKTLESNPKIQELVLPLSNLAGKEGVYPFSIQFSVLP